MEFSKGHAMRELRQNFVAVHKMNRCGTSIARAKLCKRKSFA
jgi:hypothetical protein